MESDDGLISFSSSSTIRKVTNPCIENHFSRTPKMIELRSSLKRLNRLLDNCQGMIRNVAETVGNVAMNSSRQVEQDFETIVGSGNGISTQENRLRKLSSRRPPDFLQSSYLLPIAPQPKLPKITESNLGDGNLHGVTQLNNMKPVILLTRLEDDEYLLKKFKLKRRARSQWAESIDSSPSSGNEQSPKVDDGEDDKQVTTCTQVTRVTRSKIHQENSDQLTIHICNGCAKSYIKEGPFNRHKTNCLLKSTKPPGNPVYQKGNIEIFEVDGLQDQLYCYNLSKIAKIYVNSVSGLKHVQNFLYYVLYVSGIIAGCFTKGRTLNDSRNLSVLLVLPTYRKLGLGSLLIGLCYEISKIDNQIGRPERPLSVSGHICFMSYWKQQVTKFFSTHHHEGQALTVEMLSKETFIHVEDLRITLQELNPDATRNNFNIRLSDQTLTEPSGNDSGHDPSTTSIFTLFSNSNVSTMAAYNRKYILDVDCIRYIPLSDRVLNN